MADRSRPRSRKPRALSMNSSVASSKWVVRFPTLVNSAPENEPELRISRLRGGRRPCFIAIPRAWCFGLVLMATQAFSTTQFFLPMARAQGLKASAATKARWLSGCETFWSGSPGCVSQVGGTHDRVFCAYALAGALDHLFSDFFFGRGLDAASRPWGWTVKRVFFRGRGERRISDCWAKVFL